MVVAHRKPAKTYVLILFFSSSFRDTNARPSCLGAFRVDMLERGDDLQVRQQWNYCLDVGVKM